MTDLAHRSVFTNFETSHELKEPAGAVEQVVPEKRPGEELETTPERALARSYLYRFLGRIFEDPDEAGSCWLRDATVHAAARQAADDAGLGAAVEPLLDRLARTESARFSSDYLCLFGHAARGQCPLNEIEYGDLQADPLFQPHRLADLAGFYRAFGLELTDDAGERQDHLCLELEFMSVLSAKEAYALLEQFQGETLQICLESQRTFLQEHLARWLPVFERLLGKAAPESVFAVAGTFLSALVQRDCQRFGLRWGNQELTLRPIDSAESLCTSCGLAGAQPV